MRHPLESQWKGRVRPGGKGTRLPHRRGAWSANNTAQGGKIYHSPCGEMTPRIEECRVRMRARILLQNDGDYGSPALYS